MVMDAFCDKPPAGQLPASDAISTQSTRLLFVSRRRP
jgi:hypothetical protein